MMRVEQEIPDQPDVERLLRDADAAVAALYPGVDRRGPGVAALLEAGVRWFVARVDGRAAGCGGFVPGAVEWAELVRVFVDPAARSTGIGQGLVRAAEALAANERFTAMRLETGVRAEAAVRLYRRLGYVERAPYGVHADEALSMFMEKRLGAAAQTG